MEIRGYQESDASATLDAFLAAVTMTAAADYSPEQITAWAGPSRRNEASWNRARIALNTIVALVDEKIAGFSDVSDDGFIDMMFVAPRFTRQGVAAALISALTERARSTGAGALTANVSITARPFFESQGFIVIAEQYPVINDVQLTNFAMRKELG